MFFAYPAYLALHDPFLSPFDWRDLYRGKYDQGHDTTRADRIARMAEMGIIPENATLLLGLPAMPACADLSEDERRAAARQSVSSPS